MRHSTPDNMVPPPGQYGPPPRTEWSAPPDNMVPRSIKHLSRVHPSRVHLSSSRPIPVTGDRWPPLKGDNPLKRDSNRCSFLMAGSYAPLRPTTRLCSIEVLRWN